MLTCAGSGAAVDLSVNLTLSFLGIGLLSSAMVFADSHLETDEGPAGQPALVVVIAIDQLRRDRLNDSFAGGLRRLIKGGRVFSQAKLNHAVSTTCPGHSVMLTGYNPGKAGIAGNRFIDKQAWESRYCVDDIDPDNQVFGREINRSPRNLLVSTLGDWLKVRDARSRVFAVGGKDRAVITMAGHGADGVYWFDSTQGIFTSSRYYVDSLPAYVTDYNGSDPLVDGFLSELPDFWLHPAGSRRADDYPGEDEKLSNSSGHPLARGAREEIASQVYQSPFVDSFSFALATHLVRQEKLGQRGVTDLLAIALSATDTVGHLYGPFSAESADTLRNVDEKLGDFLTFLDSEVGTANYVVVLTADHGVAELPEWGKENGTMQCPDESGRAGEYGFRFRFYWYIYSRFTFPLGNPGDLVKMADSQLTVNRRYAQELGVDVDEVIAGVRQMLEAEDVIERTWTAAEINVDGGEIARLYRNSFVPGKSGDLFIQPHHSCLIRNAGTTHGSPHSYDRNIPLVFYGEAIVPGRTDVEAYSVDIAPTLARLLGMESPAGLDGKQLRLN